MPARLGIGIIHQELELVDTLDAAGNVFLGREPHRGGPLRLLDRRRMEADTERQLARIGAPIAPRTLVRRLSTAQQQFVAIARALSMNARLLVLDEPTASLGSTDAERLHAVLRDLQAHGTAIVYISHRLREIEALADRAAVLRDGRNAGAAASRRAHARSPRAADGRPCPRAGTGTGAGRGRPARDAATAGRSRSGRDATRRSRCRWPSIAGEVLGIAGLIGAGRSELAEAICGVGPRTAGRVLIDGEPLTIHSARDAIRAGICLVPEDRRGRGVIGGDERAREHHPAGAWRLHPPRRRQARRRGQRRRRHHDAR